ncbi:hypothetical protein O1611_g8823 [Lasiodiplodia mahajangana]|uniref:Uncharacterized protein n=1 Tax=Lasiodiplodia mahajangana TaxID=1108764 RepID=A0ACC2JBQ4_9PEZI|nr:hypothetical protein O1611_g8823 [Lasiodiplodia mahajangana]
MGPEGWAQTIAGTKVGQAALAQSDFTGEPIRASSPNLVSSTISPSGVESKNQASQYLSPSLITQATALASGLPNRTDPHEPPKVELDKSEQPITTEPVGNVEESSRNEGVSQPQPDGRPDTHNGDPLFSSRVQNLPPNRSLELQTEDLGSLLWHAMELQYDPFVPMNRRAIFLPERKLYEMINEVSVKQELLQHFPESEATTIAAHICQPKQEQLLDERNGPLLKIFAILLLIEFPQAIKDFISAQVSDLELPFRKLGNGNLPANRGRVLLGQKHNPNIPVRGIFDRWSHLKIDNFERYQWSVISPVLSREKDKKSAVHFEFKDDVVLPFCKHLNTSKFSGRYGVSSRVHIRKEHHDFDELVGSSAAVKQLYTESEAEFKREIEIMKGVGESPHNHLNPLLATYRQHGRYHLIFPLADSDLMKYWRDVEPKPVFRDTVLWAARQFHGIAAGLEKVHAFPKWPIHRDLYHASDQGIWYTTRFLPVRGE